MRSSPVIAGTHALVIAPPNLHAINLSTQATEWSANGSFTGTPAVANGVVYAISGGTLQARALSGLGLSWSFSGDSALSFPPVIAAGYVYVSSPSNVYAVNASTGQQVWTAAVGGWLSIAEGRLFVARPNGTLQTFTLTP
jgi:outer membrane protein assembly factor BamB